MILVLDTDGEIARFFSVFGLILALGAMIPGPLDIRSWPIACGVTASFAAPAGMFFALQSQNESDDVSREQTSAMMMPVEQFAPMTQSHDDGANGEIAGEVEESEQPVEQKTPTSKVPVGVFQFSSLTLHGPTGVAATAASRSVQ